MEQGSYEWFKVRLGKITGSEMRRVMGGPRAWASYARQLREEAALLVRIENGEAIELGNTFDNAAMAWGHEWEPRARAEYAFLNDVDVKRAGFKIHPVYPFIGCSVDGDIFNETDLDDGLPAQKILDGIAEIKCPYSEAVHLSTLAAGRVPDEHYPQIHTGIWVADVDWAAFISYDPRRDTARKLFQRIVQRDQQYIRRMEERCLEFWDFVQSCEDEPGRIKSNDFSSGKVPQIF